MSTSRDNEKAAPKVDRRLILLVSLVLFFLTLALYWPATHHGFLVFDDDRYVTENAWVQGGLSWSGVCWAFTTLAEEFWHPLTWLSYMLDDSVFGLYAGGFHLTNILLHAANSLLLFLWLKRVSGAIWASALAAALFAWHPLHVESVAWIAERKDLLSTLFLLLTLWAYSAYAEKKTPARYLAALGLFALGLMAKPMLVTLPVLLLLLDFWPLQRVTGDGWRVAGLPTLVTRHSSLFLEKIPFFALALAAGAVTVVAQRLGGSLKTAGQVSFSLRALNAPASYGRYLCHTICPVDLCVYYPLPIKLPGIPAVCGVLVLVGISFLVLRRAATRPWLAVGWAWFLVSLLPVIGLLQVGSHAMADRYTYIPLIGLFVAAAWELREFANSPWRRARILAVGAAVIFLVLCAGLSRMQLSFWRDDLALFTRAVSVTENNPVAQANLGVALSNAGRLDEASVQYREALLLKPDYATVHYNLGSDLAAKGDWPHAEHHFAEALKITPDDEKLQNNYGLALVQRGRFLEAIEHFQQAAQIRPDYPKPYFNCARAFQCLGQNGAALTNYAKAVSLDPDALDVLNNYAQFLATCPETALRNPALAVALATHADELTHHESAATLDTLALAYAAGGNFSNAVRTAQTALAAAKNDGSREFAAEIAAHLQSFKNRQLPRDDGVQPGGAK